MLNVISQPGVNLTNNNKQNEVLKGHSNYLVMLEVLIVVLLHRVPSPGCVINYVGTILLVEARGSHGIRIIFDPGKINEIYPLLCDIVIFSNLVENTL